MGRTTMYSVVFAVILNGPSLGLELDQTSVRWQDDYATASGKGRAAGKPLAVFFGPGGEGWRKLAREGALSADVVELLRSEYVALHVDTDSKAGKAWAAQFDVPQGVGLVISNRTGEVQAFHPSGQLADADLTRYLRRYAAAQSVTTTETVAGQAVAARQVIYSSFSC